MVAIKILARRDRGFGATPEVHAVSEVETEHRAVGLMDQLKALSLCEITSMLLRITLTRRGAHLLHAESQCTRNIFVLVICVHGVKTIGNVYGRTKFSK